MYQTKPKAKPTKSRDPVLEPETKPLPPILAALKAQYGSTPPPLEVMAEKVREVETAAARQQLLESIQACYGNAYVARLTPMVLDKKTV